MLIFGIVSNLNSQENNSILTKNIKILKKVSTDYIDGIPQDEETLTYNYNDDLTLKSIITTVNNVIIETVEIEYQEGKIKKLINDFLPTKNRLKSSVIATYNYTDNLITSSTVNSNGKFATFIFTYNTLKQVVKEKVLTDGIFFGEKNCKYNSDGNLTKQIYSSFNLNYTHLYKSYDDKNNPFELTFSDAYLKVYNISKNNIKSSIINDNVQTYKYEYNSDNYPTKIIRKVDNKLKNITTIEYE